VRGYAAAGVGTWGIGCDSLESVFLRLAAAIEDEEAAEEAAILTGSASTALAPGSKSIFFPDSGSGGSSTQANGGSSTSGGRKNQRPSVAGSSLNGRVSAGPSPRLGDFAVLDRLNSSMQRQIAAIFTRRMRETLRDRRGIWLLWILPVIIVGVSFALLQTQRAFEVEPLHTVNLSPEAALAPGQLDPNTRLASPFSPAYSLVGPSAILSRNATRAYAELLASS